MYSVRATKKLLDRLKVVPAPTVTEPGTALGNWYATAIFTRPQVALFVNERTMVPVVVLLAPASTVVARFPTALEAVLMAHGVDPRMVASELHNMRDVTVSKTANRSLVGVMGEDTGWIERMIRTGASSADLLAISMRLSNVLLGPLMKNNGPGSPDRALRDLVAEQLA